MTTRNHNASRSKTTAPGFLALSLLLFSALPLLAQEITLKGRVIDPDGNALPSATVELIDRTRVRERATSGPDGLFHIELHSLGQFVIKVDAPGFRPVEQAVNVVASANAEIIVKVTQLLTQNDF